MNTKRADRLRVWVGRELERDFEFELRQSLEAGPGDTGDPEDPVELTIGGRGPQDYDVLVEGVPSRSQLTRSERLASLVIPYAGLPEKTRGVMAEFPKLRVYNLHHNAKPTAEMALTLGLAVGKQVVRAHERLKRGDWTLRYGPSEGRLFAGARATVLGYGSVGRHLGKLLTAFGVEVRGVRAHPDPERADEFGVEALAELLPQSDLLFVCLPLTLKTRGLLGEAQLAALPRGAILVNVGRADVCDQDALFDALASKRLLGAGLDVWYHYPEDEAERSNTRPARRAFWSLDNVVMSPHRAAHSSSTASLRARALADLLLQLARGQEPRAVDLTAGY